MDFTFLVVTALVFALAGLFGAGFSCAKRWRRGTLLSFACFAIFAFLFAVRMVPLLQPRIGHITDMREFVKHRPLAQIPIPGMSSEYITVLEYPAEQSYLSVDAWRKRFDCVAIYGIRKLDSLAPIHRIQDSVHPVVENLAQSVLDTQSVQAPSRP